MVISFTAISHRGRNRGEPRRRTLDVSVLNRQLAHRGGRPSPDIAVLQLPGPDWLSRSRAEPAAAPNYDALALNGLAEQIPPE